MKDRNYSSMEIADILEVDTQAIATITRQHNMKPANKVHGYLCGPHGKAVWTLDQVQDIIRINRFRIRYAKKDMIDLVIKAEKKYNMRIEDLEIL